MLAKKYNRSSKLSNNMLRKMTYKHNKLQISTCKFRRFKKRKRCSKI